MGAAIGTGRRQAPAVEIEVFATGATIVHHPHEVVALPAPPHDAASIGGFLRHGGELIRDGFEHARSVQARPGPRLGAAPTICLAGRARSGTDTDIVQPVLVPPGFAGEFAAGGRLFADPIPHLRVHHRSTDTDARLLMWACELEGRGGPRRVTFHLLASPSMVVTVLELVPCHHVRRHRDRFIADGLAAVDAIARRLRLAHVAHRHAVGV